MPVGKPVSASAASCVKAASGGKDTVYVVDWTLNDTCGGGGPAQVRGGLDVNKVSVIEPGRRPAY